MAEKKKAYVDSAWENNKAYPEKRDVCDFCLQKDDLKLSFDRCRFICINAHACYLRWTKTRAE